MKSDALKPGLLNTATSPYATLDGHDGWRQWLPPECQKLSQQEWNALSQNQNWAPFFRILHRKDVCRYRKRDLLIWFKLKFGVSHPHCVQALIDAGYDEFSESTAAPNSKMRAKAKKKARTDV